MLNVAIRRVAEGEVDRLRWWMGELMRRRDEVIETFQNEGVRHEVAYLISLAGESILVYVADVDDPEQAGAAFRSSTLPIDQEHKEVMGRVLAGQIHAELLYDVHVSA